VPSSVTTAMNSTLYILCNLAGVHPTMIANKNYKCFLQLLAGVDNCNSAALMKMRLVSQRDELERNCDDEHIRLNIYFTIRANV